MSAFDDWLAKLKAAQKGPAPLYATRGRDFIQRVSIEGDWSAFTLRGEVRISPDADGSPQATFNVIGPDISGAYTNFVISLSGAATAGLPAAADGEGFIELAYDLLMAGDFGYGDTEDLVVGGIFNLTGRITE